jgi:hypothetical protein
LARIVLGVGSLLLLLLFLCVGNAARVLLGFFRTTCTAPHDELLNVTASQHSFSFVQYLVCFVELRITEDFQK